MECAGSGWNKQYDHEFLRFLGCSDTFLLKETGWSPPLPQWMVLSYTIPLLLRLIRRGEAVGGLAIVIKKNLHIEAELLSHDCKNLALVFLLKGTPLGFLPCINVYFPSNGYVREKVSSWGKLLALLERLMIQYLKLTLFWEVILMPELAQEMI